jgi:hypothetical protein
MKQYSSAKNVVEKRRDLRYGVTGMPNAKLLSPGGDEITFFFVDASKHGLGIIVDTPIQIGANVLLTIEDTELHKFNLEVRWLVLVDLLATSTEPNQSLYRCGLQAIDSELDVVSILSKCQNVSLEALV